MRKQANSQPSSSASPHFWDKTRILVPKMKNRATAFLKQVFSMVVTVVKAKSLAVKSKTSTMKTQLLIFGLLRNKKILASAISHKIHALMGQEKEEEGAPSAEDYSKAIMQYNAEKEDAPLDTPRIKMVEYDEEDDYPDLRHSLFGPEDAEEDDGLGDGTGSLIDMVKNSKEDGEDFILEDEIDHVADMFIKRFHKQMRMQKLDSFKRYQDMMERSV